jgi:hypothetical protein
LNELLKSCTSVVNLFGIINTEPNLVYITNKTMKVIYEYLLTNSPVR